MTWDGWFHVFVPAVVLLALFGACCFGLGVVYEDDLPNGKALVALALGALWWAFLLYSLLLTGVSP